MVLGSHTQQIPANLLNFDLNDQIHKYKFLVLHYRNKKQEWQKFLKEAENLGTIQQILILLDKDTEDLTTNIG